MTEEKLKVYQVRTNDGTLHTVEALYAFNNDDKGGSLIFRTVEGDRKPVVAEFARGAWAWYRLEPKPQATTELVPVWPTDPTLNVDTDLGIGSEHLSPSKRDLPRVNPFDRYEPTDEDRYGRHGQG